MKVYLAGQSRRSVWIRALSQALEKAFPWVEITPKWWDFPDLPLLSPRDKDSFWQGIAEKDRQGVRGCDRMLVLLCPGVKTSGVWWEMGLAEGLGKPVEFVIIHPPNDDYLSWDIQYPGQNFDQIFLSGIPFRVFRDQYFDRSLLRTGEDREFLGRAEEFFKTHLVKFFEQHKKPCPWCWGKGKDFSGHLAREVNCGTCGGSGFQCQ